MKKIALHRVLLILTTFSLVACGGGGGGGGGSPKTVQASPPDAAANVVPIVIDGGPLVGSPPQHLGTINQPYVTLTICTPGTSQCQTIDHILVDTGSTGLRIMSSVLSSAVNLPTTLESGAAILECTQFAGSYSWGPRKVVDLKLGNQQVAGLPVQIIGDPLFSVPPTSCSNLGKSLNSVAALGANGVLGVGVFENDCGTACVQNAFTGVYFSCTLSGCQPITRNLAQQIPNPVTRFTTDNNGVIIDLPPVTASGSAALTGSLIFGIGTQANNGLGNARVLALNSLGEFTTLYNSASLTHSFIDSGSNGLFFPDNTNIANAVNAVCGFNSIAPGFYCPASTLTLSAVQQSLITGANVAVNFSVANAVDLLTNNSTNNAFNNIGGSVGASLFNSFDWGLPFFLGRKIFTAINGQSTPAGLGPYIAY